MVVEQKHFNDLVAAVDNGLETLYKVGMALMQIRDNRYYRVTHSTFADQLIMSKYKPMGDIEL